jgi:hypothetical protein
MARVVHNLSEFLAALSSAMVRQVVLGFGLIAVLGLALSLTQRWIFLNLYRAIGLKGVVTWTGWLGTPIHELSHWLVAKCTFIHVTELKLYEPDPDDGVLGYVRYRVPQLRWQELHKVVGTFLMGVAPLFGGALVLMLALHLLSSDSRALLDEAGRFAQLVEHAQMPEVTQGFISLVKATYGAVFSTGPLSWRPWVFLYIGMCVGAHLAPSRADLQGGFVGLLVLVVLALFANSIALLLHADPGRAAETLARWTGPLAALLLVALTLNLGNLTLAVILARILGRSS